MNRRMKNEWRKKAAVAVVLICLTSLLSPQRILSVRGEELIELLDDGSAEESGMDLAAAEDAETVLPEGGMLNDVEKSVDSASVESDPGSFWTPEEGWAADGQDSTSEETVFRQSIYMDAENTSTIRCSYMDTNYSVMEYEQLRDMLTNNMVYNNVTAQISTSAVYTDARDYLYIIIADDSSLEYRDIYHYVVGDYRCFCVEVREYRSEADQLKILQQKTPQEMGQSIAEKFTWGAE